MYKSPIELEVENIVSDVVKQVDEYTLRCFQQIGINVDKDELIRALEYDRRQYEKGWNDRDREIVRCKDCTSLYDGWCIDYGIHMDDNEFCSGGERRQTDETD